MDPSVANTSLPLLYFGGNLKSQGSLIEQKPDEGVSSPVNPATLDYRIVLEPSPSIIKLTCTIQLEVSFACTMSFFFYDTTQGVEVGGPLIFVVQNAGDELNVTLTEFVDTSLLTSAQTIDVRYNSSAVTTVKELSWYFEAVKE